MLMILEKSQNFTYYAGIMLDAIAILLCSKLCWLKPTVPSNYNAENALKLFYN